MLSAGGWVMKPTFTFGTMCSGIEAVQKTCAKCQVENPLEGFHRHPGGPHGRHSYCKPCANAVQRESRRRRPAEYSIEQKTRWNLKRRYGLTPDDVQAMAAAQGGACAICAGPMLRQTIDHDHATGAVRGLLCHRCNIGLPYVEEDGYREAALRYLAAHAPSKTGAA